MQTKTLQAACNGLEEELNTEKRRHADVRDELTSLNQQIARLNTDAGQLEETKQDLQRQVST